MRIETSIYIHSTPSPTDLVLEILDKGRSWGRLKAAVEAHFHLLKLSENFLNLQEFSITFLIESTRGLYHTIFHLVAATNAKTTLVLTDG